MEKFIILNLKVVLRQSNLKLLVKLMKQEQHRFKADPEIFKETTEFEYDIFATRIT